MGSEVVGVERQGPFEVRDRFFVTPKRLQHRTQVEFRAGKVGTQHQRLLQ